jgi:selenocysteine lyase/cysteine desulfurase
LSHALPPLACQRGAFSLPAGVHYFNCAYMSPQPRAVEAAGAAALLRKNDPSAVGPADFFRESDAVRAAFATLVGAPEPADVALVPSVSYGTATVARNVPVAAGQNVVLAAEQFPSNVYAWRRLCAERGLELRMVAAPASVARGEGWNERLLAAVDGATALVALPHVHWTDGTRFDLETIGARARAVGAWFVIDGTQSVGALPFDVTSVQPDALICAGYKWLLGPYALGVAWYGPRMAGGVPLEESWIGRADSHDFRQLIDYRDDYAPGAARFDMGERSNFLLAPMLLAALELVNGWQPARIQAYCASLLEPVLEEAAGLGFVVETAAYRASHLVGVRLPHGADAALLHAALTRHGVVASLRGSALRLAPHLYNDADDAAALRAALHDVAAETRPAVNA